jgi:tetratricopeptide (TPR) repeat protein
MMKRRTLLGCLIAATWTSGAAAQTPLRNKPDPTLDSLFERLAKAQAPAQAAMVAEAIRRRLGRSGSDTADLLVSRANGALVADDPALAIELLDRAIMLRPHWAEGWNSRALVFFALEDHTRAMADLVEVLRLEPRHYQAMMGLGAIMQQRGQVKAAYHLYQRAQAIYPLYDKSNEAIEKLRPQVEGRDL